jgi:hypothetical protein
MHMKSGEGEGEGSTRGGITKELSEEGRKVGKKGRGKV